MKWGLSAGGEMRDNICTEIVFAMDAIAFYDAAAIVVSLIRDIRSVKPFRDILFFQLSDKCCEV